MRPAPGLWTRDEHECFKVDSYDCWVKNRLDQKRAEAEKIM